MNGLAAQLAEAQAVRDALVNSHGRRRRDDLPAGNAAGADGWAVKGSKLVLRRPGLPSAATGAHTGDIAAEMLADAGATAVIVGHSERRAGHGELDSIVRSKAAAAHRAGLTAIVCVGETAGERRRG